MIKVSCFTQICEQGFLRYHRYFQPSYRYWRDLNHKSPLCNRKIPAPFLILRKISKRALFLFGKIPTERYRYFGVEQYRYFSNEQYRYLKNQCRVSGDTQSSDTRHFLFSKRVQAKFRFKGSDHCEQRFKKGAGIEKGNVKSTEKLEWRNYSNPPAQTESAVCSRSEECIGCPFPASGFIRWVADGECMKTRLQKL